MNKLIPEMDELESIAENESTENERKNIIAEFMDLLNKEKGYQLELKKLAQRKTALKKDPEVYFSKKNHFKDGTVLSSASLTDAVISWR
ncbi:MAG TPA: hypothetical protein ENH95_02945 [Nitrosopumilus sp.]|nr:hypothetical protein [Nitrosopumilus sp.]